MQHPLTVAVVTLVLRNRKPWDNHCLVQLKTQMGVLHPWEGSELPSKEQQEGERDFAGPPNSPDQRAERMKGSQELPITLTTKTYDKALMSVPGRSWECAKESTSESGHVSNLGVYETGKGRVRVHGENPMTKAWSQDSDEPFLHLPALSGSCPLCAACAGRKEEAIAGQGWMGVVALGLEMLSSDGLGDGHGHT